MTTDLSNQPNSELILYQTEDGYTRIEVRLQEETVWLNQKMIAELFQKDVRTINEHIQNIYNEQELQSQATIRNFRIVQTEGSREVTRQVDFYNLDMIISVGYRVNSHSGTQFRIWATQRLKEYLIKGLPWMTSAWKGVRLLGIPIVKDRVLHMAIKMVLEPNMLKFVEAKCFLLLRRSLHAHL
ncbi:MAG TPA: RhuM family protein [Waddliaceae bacterium]